MVVVTLRIGQFGPSKKFLLWNPGQSCTGKGHRVWMKNFMTVTAHWLMDRHCDSRVGLVAWMEATSTVWRLSGGWNAWVTLKRNSEWNSSHGSAWGRLRRSAEWYIPSFKLWLMTQVAWLASWLIHFWILYPARDCAMVSAVSCGTEERLENS